MSDHDCPIGIPADARSYCSAGTCALCTADRMRWLEERVAAIPLERDQHVRAARASARALRQHYQAENEIERTIPSRDMREQRGREYHREVNDGSEWDLLSEEQRECYRQSAERLHARWTEKGDVSISTLTRERDEARDRLARIETQFESCATAAGHSPIASYPVSTSITRLRHRAEAADAAMSARNARVTEVLDKACEMQSILLMAGEMTAQERRTARAVANGLASKVRTALNEGFV